MTERSTLYEKMRVAGFDVYALAHVAVVVHGTNVTDRETALADLLDYLGVLPK